MSQSTMVSSRCSPPWSYTKPTLLSALYRYVPKNPSLWTRYAAIIAHECSFTPRECHTLTDYCWYKLSLEREGETWETSWSSHGLPWFWGLGSWFASVFGCLGIKRQVHPANWGNGSSKTCRFSNKHLFFSQTGGALGTIKKPEELLATKQSVPIYFSNPDVVSCGACNYNYWTRFSEQR